MKRFLVKLHWILSSQFGVDPQRLLRSFRGFPFYISDWWKFRRSYKGKLEFKPCLHDKYEEGGVTKSEYFWQDLLVAQWIYKSNPLKHVDVGSRIDGFVAHVASFRQIEVFDVRPISSMIPGVVFSQADLMEVPELVREEHEGYCDSVSCLHTIEHFGLGRYGDPIDILGYEKGITNLASLIKPGGTLYLSTPIGIERVEFNANRVFNPHTIIDVAELNALKLESLVVISDGSVQDIDVNEGSLRKLSEEIYSLGIFTFKKA